MNVCRGTHGIVCTGERRARAPALRLALRETTRRAYGKMSDSSVVRGMRRKAATTGRLGREQVAGGPRWWGSAAFRAVEQRLDRVLPFRAGQVSSPSGLDVLLAGPKCPPAGHRRRPLPRFVGDVAGLLGAVEKRQCAVCRPAGRGDRMGRGSVRHRPARSPCDEDCLRYSGMTLRGWDTRSRAPVE